MNSMLKKKSDVQEDKARVGGWIQTWSGKSFFPLDHRHAEIDINDIIHALSNQSRFAGHCTKFYSVAQHSVHVSHMCPDDSALWGLLHDASEAYLCDIPSPLKRCPEFAFYRDAEKRLMNVICDVFGLEHDEPPVVKEADKRMLATEARDLTMTQGRGWDHPGAVPYDLHIVPWEPEYARAKFVSRFHELTLMRKT